MNALHDAAGLQRRLGQAHPSQLVDTAINELFPGRIAVVSSFGADAAVLLHLVAKVKAQTPVLFIDTGRHFPETLRYRDLLAAHLGLADVRTIGPTADEVALLDPDTARATWDPDGCCAFRKAVPLQRALQGFSAWITGRKRFQSVGRQQLAAFEVDGAHIKINPLARWEAGNLAAYAAEYALPAHPLAMAGFASIGCAPCTTARRPGEDLRAGRWRGLAKTECGIHRPFHRADQEAKAQ